MAAEKMEKPLELEVTNFTNASSEMPTDYKASVAQETIELQGEESAQEVDPFIPFPVEDDQPTEESILTFRAIIVGCCLGALVNASNVYLGLKTGWTFSANLFGAIFGFGIIKFISKNVGENFPILGGYFGPKENAIVQTAATAAGGLSGLFVAAIPALYQLNLLSADPADDFWRLLTFTLVSAYYGFLFATPLRKFFIVHVARELRLIFPTATATALTIRSMHAVGSGSVVAMKKTKALIIAFVVAICWRVASYYALGILWDWHIFTWFYIWGNYSNYAIVIESWGWMIEWTPAFIGSGMLVGLNPAFSFFGGTFLAWGVIGPILVATGTCFGLAPAEGDPQWGSYMNYAHFRNIATAPSPRYWLLWPGVMIMICSSFAELFIQYKIIWFAMKSVFSESCSGLNKLASRRGKSSPFLEKHSTSAGVEASRGADPAPQSEQVKTWMWAPGILVVVIATCAILGVQYGMNVGTSILAVILGFVFAFLAIQCSGVTDITPLTAAAKASQLVFGGVTSGAGYAIEQAQRLNLIAGAVASGAAGQSSDLVADFRVGFLLRTPPRQQWYAQAIGSMVAVWLSPGIFLLFAKAYPCVLNAEAETCPFAAPSVAAWRAVAVAVTDPQLPIPKSSGIFACLMGALSVAVVIVRHFYLVGEREKYRQWVPNFMALSLAFVVPQTVYSTAMVMGAVTAYLWAKKSFKTFEVYCYAVAAGLIAGEGLGGVIGAILQIADVAGDKYGTMIACPMDSC